MEYTITKKSDFNSLEISFTEKPTEEIRNALKALKYRWHGVRRVWYGYTTEEAARAAIDGAECTQSTQGAQPVTPSSSKKSKAEKPGQNRIRIYYNGIKLDGGSIIRCYYSLDNNAEHKESVSIGCMDYSGDLPSDLLPVTNGTDIYTDYFEKDHSYITPEHPLYKYFRYAAMKDRARNAEKRIAELEKTLNSNAPERWQGQRAAYERERETCRKHIAEYTETEDPGQPTAADLEKINQQRMEQENRERAEQHAAELAERERVLNARNNGRRFIEETAKKYPMQDGAPYVLIHWSEHPAFYAWADDELKLSLPAAEIILSTLDSECANIEHYGYDKTKFTIYYNNENGEACTYQGRYDLGDNEGGLIAHIRSLGEWEKEHEGNDERIKEADYLQQFTAQEIA